MEEKGRNVIVIDSRYSFEYEGSVKFPLFMIKILYLAGHISKSININNPFNLESLFFEYGHLLFSQNFLKKLPFFSKIEKKEQENWLKEQNNDKMNYEDLLEEPPVIVIHCEFSQKRGPKLFRYMRKRDREINESHYPNLIYPNILLLSGGYSSYVKDFPVNY